MSNFYTGIGSRETPKDICEMMTEVAKIFRKEGWILRSGHAVGADWAFEQGALDKAEIYIPWKNFGVKDYLGDKGRVYLGTPIYNPEQALRDYKWLIEKGIRSSADIYTKESMKLLHGRNVSQVLGDNRIIPNISKFVLYYCIEDHIGNPTGGTATAVKVANYFNIPTFNLYKEEVRQRIKKKIIDNFEI